MPSNLPEWMVQWQPVFSSSRGVSSSPPYFIRLLYVVVPQHQGRGQLLNLPKKLRSFFVLVGLPQDTRGAGQDDKFESSCIDDCARIHFELFEGVPKIRVCEAVPEWINVHIIDWGWGGGVLFLTSVFAHSQESLSVRDHVWQKIGSCVRRSLWCGVKMTIIIGQLLHTEVIEIMALHIHPHQRQDIQDKWEGEAGSIWYWKLITLLNFE